MHHNNDTTCCHNVISLHHHRIFPHSLHTLDNISFKTEFTRNHLTGHYTHALHPINESPLKNICKHYSTLEFLEYSVCKHYTKVRHNRLKINRCLLLASQNHRQLTIIVTATKNWLFRYRDMRTLSSTT